MGDSITQAEGTVIEGRYRIVRRIASGGMATVFLALDQRLDRNVAIKVMHAQLANGPHRDQFVERFHREAKSAASIANPHIVQVYDTGEYDDREYLVMEYVHGVNLREEMSRRVTFDVRSAIRILVETLDGLASAHQAGVVHRDIKPENILINDRGRVQITDFGLAKAASQSTLSSTGMLLGTASYLAPELIESNISTTQGDLYSVGMMTWEMLAGRLPFISDNPVTLVFRHVHEDVPSITTACDGIHPAIAEFIGHLTARDPQKRPRDAVEAFSLIRELIPRLPSDAWNYRLAPDQSSDGDADGAILKPRPVDMTDMTEETAQGGPPTPPDVHSNDVPSVTSAVQSTVHPTGSNPTVPVAPAPEQSPDASGQQATIVVESPDDPMSLASITDDDPPREEPRTASPMGARVRAVLRHPIIITVVIASALLAIAGGTAAWWYLQGPGSYWTIPQPAGLSCVQNHECTIRDVSWASYEKSIKVAGIPYSVTRKFSDDVSEGRIISTSPATVGAHLNRRGGDTLSVVVSKGVRLSTVPKDILDTTTANGKDPLAALKKAGFTNITHHDDGDSWSTTVPKGAVVSISLDPGETVKHSDPVTVILSKGPMPVNMPDVVGKTQDQAQSEFDDAKLTVTYTKEYSDSVKKGVIISTSQAAGVELHWGDSVEAVVSKGPETAVIPSLVGKSASDATNTLEGLGFSVKTQGLNILGLVQQQSAKGATRLRDTDGKATVVTLTVV